MSPSSPEPVPVGLGSEDDRLAFLRLQAGVNEALAAPASDPAENPASVASRSPDGKSGGEDGNEDDGESTGGGFDRGTAADPRDEWSDEPDDIDGEEKTAAVERILGHAKALAASLKHRDVLIGHFMLAMSMEDEAIRALEGRGHDVPRIRARWYGRLGEEESVMPGREPGLALKVRRLLGRAGRYARTREPELRLVAVADILSELSRAASDYDPMLTQDFGPTSLGPVLSGEPQGQPAESSSELLQAIAARIDQLDRSVNQLRYDPETSRRFGRIEQQIEKVQVRLEELAGQKAKPDILPDLASSVPIAGPVDRPVQNSDGRKKGRWHLW